MPTVKRKIRSYEDVRVIRDTGHAETVKVTYDADKLSLDDILQYYFRVALTQPASTNKATRTEYRSAVCTTPTPPKSCHCRREAKREQQNTNSLVAENELLKKLLPTPRNTIRTT